MVTAVQSLLLNYQPNYNSHRNYQSNRVRNQLMFAQSGKTGDNKGEGKEKQQRPRRNLDHITCNDCGEKGHFYGNSELPTEAKLKEDSEAFNKTNQDKSSNKTPGEGDQKALVNVEDASCSLMTGSPTKEQGELPSTDLMFCQTSTQELPQTEPTNNNLKKDNARIMYVGDTTLAFPVEAEIDENWCLLDNQSSCNAFTNKNTSQISEMLPMDNI